MTLREINYNVRFGFGIMTSKGVSVHKLKSITSNSLVGVNRFLQIIPKMSSTDQLTKIERQDLPLLKQLYTPDGKKSYTAYTTIDTYIQWFDQDPDLQNHISFFSLNGDFTRGTFVVTDRLTRTAFADTISETTDELLRLLLLLDYSKGYFFISITDHASSAVREAIKLKNVEIYTDDWNLLYYLPKEKALEFNTEPSEGIELKPLTEFSDIQKAFSLWPVGNRSSVKLLERLAKFNPSAGAFANDGTVMAWVFRFATGLLCDLQTDENYYGKGYGALVTRNISKQIAQMDHDIYAGIFEVNTASRRLFGKLGFKHIGKVHWICTKIDWTEDDE